MSAVHRAIYGERKRLGLDDDTARAFYLRVVGKDHLTQMTDAEHRKVLSQLRGVRPGPMALVEAPSRPPSKRIQGPYGKKLQALWIAMWHLGLTRDRTDEGLAAFVRKQTKVDHTRFLVDPAEAKKAIEALKGWMAREAGVEWTPMRGHAWLKHDAAKVALAQWRILYPGALIGICDTDFSEAVWAALGRPERLKSETIGALTMRDWQQVNKAWGAEVRRRRRS